MSRDVVQDVAVEAGHREFSTVSRISPGGGAKCLPIAFF